MLQLNNYIINSNVLHKIYIIKKLKNISFGDAFKFLAIKFFLKKLESNNSIKSNQSIYLSINQSIKWEEQSISLILKKMMVI
jgi:hypothetical protein